MSAATNQPPKQPHGQVGAAMVVDGALLEGGGQVLRNGAAYSFLLHRPITINNIRAGRSKPGLAAQHLAGLRLIAELSGGSLEGGELRSTVVTITPGDSAKGGQFLADPKTAGSICLLLQASLPCTLFSAAPCALELRGGTNASFAPQIDYFTQVFLPVAQTMGMDVSIEVAMRGYFPRGGGVVHVKTRPAKHLTAVVLKEQGTVSTIKVRAYVAGKDRKKRDLPIEWAEAMAQEACDKLAQEFPDAAIEAESVRDASANNGMGTGIFIKATTTTGCILGGSALGNTKEDRTVTARKAANELIGAVRAGGCVDDWLQDQLIIYMALAEGTSELLVGGLTLHTKTAIHHAKELSGADITVTPVLPDGENASGKKLKAGAGYGDKGYSAGQHLITCKGIGLRNSHVCQ